LTRPKPLQSPEIQNTAFLGGGKKGTTQRGRKYEKGKTWKRDRVSKKKKDPGTVALHQKEASLFVR